MKQIIFYSIILSFLLCIINNEEILANESNNVTITPRIIGAEDADIREFRYLASIRYRGRYYCVASFISDHELLSVAHCLTHTERVIWPYAGITIHYGTSSSLETGQFIRIKYAIVHPGWTGDPINLHDIVYIKADGNIVFNVYQYMVRLPNKHFDNDEWGWVTSWGNVILEGEVCNSERLQKLQMRITDYNECEPYLPANLEITKEQLCAFRSAGHGCSRGDSGAPLVIKNRIIGIHSWTVGDFRAAGLAEVFVNVFVERDFIDYAKQLALQLEAQNAGSSSGK